VRLTSLVSWSTEAFPLLSMSPSSSVLIAHAMMVLLLVMGHLLCVWVCVVGTLRAIQAPRSYRRYEVEVGAPPGLNGCWFGCLCQVGSHPTKRRASSLRRWVGTLSFLVQLSATERDPVPPQALGRTQGLHGPVLCVEPSDGYPLAVGYPPPSPR